MTQVIKRNKWEIWRDVIFALFVREIRTRFNDKFGISWSIIEPVAFIFILAFIRGRISGADTHSIPTFIFMAVGLLYIQSFISIVNSSATAVKKNKPLYAFRQVQPISPIVASSLFLIIINIFVMFGVAGIATLLNINVQLASPLLFVLCFTLLMLLGIFIGLLFAVFEMFVQEISKIRSMFTRPLFFISGVFFALQDFPKEYWHYLDWNPILHAIELSRYAMFNSYGDAGVSLSFLAQTTLVAGFLSLSCYFILWKQAVSR